MNDKPLGFRAIETQESKPPLLEDEGDNVLVTQVNSPYYSANQHNRKHHNPSISCKFSAVGPLNLLKFPADIFKKSNYPAHI